MTRLTATDLRSALDLVGAWMSTPDVESLGTAMLGLLRLVPGCQIAFNEVDMVGGTARIVYGPDPLPDWGEVALTRHRHEHPLIVAAAAGDRRVAAISDHMTEDEFHATGLYQEVLGRLGAEDQIALGIPTAPGYVVGVAINREQRGFDERDRALLELIRPHAATAYALATERVVARACLRAFDAGATGGRHVVVRDGRGQLVAASPGADAALRAAFPDDERGLLPVDVEDWLGRAPPAPLVLRRPLEDGTLVLRFLPGACPDEHDVLTIEVVEDPLGEGRLRALGLPPREAAVLRLAARGLTDAQIADELSLSVRTVHHHLHSIYGRLGVPTRTAAVARVLGLDGHG